VIMLFVSLVFCFSLLNVYHDNFHLSFFFLIMATYHSMFGLPITYQRDMGLTRLKAEVAFISGGSGGESHFLALSTF
jgi:hypothetical protein